MTPFACNAWPLGRRPNAQPLVVQVARADDPLPQPLNVIACI
jgi:hypothetical protein